MKLDYQLIFGVDKQMHFLSYAVISILLGIVLILISDRKSIKRNISLMWVVLIAIGIVEEYRQYLLPNRSAEFLDAIANMFGVTFGLAIPLLISYMIRHRNHFLFKLFTLYSIVLIPLFLGLFYFNERPFITLEEPFQEKLRNLVALIGF
ncbi:VanZ family protein [Bacillus sp. V3B]|uniref:VanZ family protein n=1 Tax=Bacillus sp. V3B TaxID=2804915 RepID=UPI00210E9E0B|nr:VanZ family protein [Bacillus sp. V3B]MCQ6274727.1 VanZ family protein [Bacillus sp. V3B]